MSGTIRPSNSGDQAEWLRMRLALWPETLAAQHRGDMQRWLGRPDTVVIVAADGPGLCGFIEVGTRSVADGCDTSPVAYVEGWYVDAGRRGRGVGAALMRAAERWAIEHGYRELASDAQLSNPDSQRAHAALGFTEAERAVLFVKKLLPTDDGHPAPVPAVLDLRPFVPAQDYALCKRFFVDLGFTLNWSNQQIAELQIGAFRFLLQDFQDYAKNYMMQLLVEDTDAWWTHIQTAQLCSKYPSIRVTPPALQSWGLKVLFLVDPSGVLWHIAEPRRERS